MPRNEAQPLSRDEAHRSYRLRDRMSEGDNVTLWYRKRDGSASTSTGEVRYFSGKDGMDTMSVTVRTPDKGDRTINLCRVVRFQKH